MTEIVEKAAAVATLLGVVGTLFFGSSYVLGGSIPSMAALVGLGGFETAGMVVSVILLAAGIVVLGRPSAEEETDAV